MALTKTIENEAGLSITDAYARVISYCVDRENQIVRAGFGVYASKDDADAGKAMVADRINVRYTDEEYEIMRGAEDIVAAIYVAEKAGEQWNGWSDA